MTDKNLADECERWMRDAEEQLRWFLSVYSESKIDFPLTRAVLARFPAALRASAAPQQTAGEFAARIHALYRDSASQPPTTFGDIMRLIEERDRATYAAGQAARAKRDAEIARTLIIDADGPIGNDQIAAAITKDAAV